eukprot:gnl/TRDRNA2_/TRDRNA2_170138_c1_seq1.p1 gnl/TRDRNA2_/TRDRNA2_170138_c1~~gnl/TRDRNA2_/TRDRNA2_170138_c1_seq1.p1  ORF type:complete len:284 (+),score=86.09 gnl/TRDRNA2_/TRDRNA2_170138_c1_seq1:575-1426(+)
MQRRWVVVDGANVGRFADAQDALRMKFRTNAPPPFSSWKVLAAVAAIEQKGMTPLVLLPQKFVSSSYPELRADDPKALLRLQERGILEQVPSNIDDDRAVIRRALEVGQSTGDVAFVLTNDVFKNHVADGFVTKQWIDSTCYRFSFSGKRCTLWEPSLNQGSSTSETLLVTAAALSQAAAATEKAAAKQAKEEEAARQAAAATAAATAAAEWMKAEVEAADLAAQAAAMKVKEAAAVVKMIEKEAKSSPAAPAKDRSTRSKKKSKGKKGKKKKDRNPDTLQAF